MSSFAITSRPPIEIAAWQARVRGLMAMMTTLVVSAFALAGVALAEMSLANWWDGIQGGGQPNLQDRDDTDRPQRTVEPLNDLRASPIPLRSDEMLNALADAIGRYEKIVAAGGWPLVPEGRMMRAGDDDPRVPILRKRLRISGDMRARGQYYDSQTFDSELEEGLRRFQSRNGIRPTGRVERSVYAVLNKTADERLAQLRLNYTRLQNLLVGVEERYILVNVPAFQLEAVERYDVAMRHRVIVGRPGRDTPVLKSTIKALNFFPFWRVPESVAHLDLIPRLRKEPQYLVNEGIRVYDGFNGPELDALAIDWNAPQVFNYKFKQDPGDKNALGLVRIDMQNEHGVYMHDTPMKPLFDQRSRAFSAGCVRVQDVFRLVDWIAKYEAGWEQPGRAEAVVQGGLPLDVNLSRPLPVYFAYITAWAEPETGGIQFRPDIYGQDGSALAAAGQFADPEDAPPPSAASLAP